MCGVILEGNVGKWILLGRDNSGSHNTTPDFIDCTGTCDGTAVSDINMFEEYTFMTSFFIFMSTVWWGQWGTRRFRFGSSKLLVVQYGWSVKANKCEFA
jgi:hypothetical protein